MRNDFSEWHLTCSWHDHLAKSLIFSFSLLQSHSSYLLDPHFVSLTYILFGLSLLKFTCVSFLVELLGPQVQLILHFRPP